MTEDPNEQPQDRPKPKPRPKARSKPRPPASTQPQATPAAQAAPRKSPTTRPAAARAAAKKVTQPDRVTNRNNAPAPVSRRVAASSSAGALAVAAGDTSEDDEGLGSYTLFATVPSWLISTVVHVIVLLALALLTLPPITRPKIEHELVLSESVEDVDNLEDFQDQPLDSIEIVDTEVVEEELPMEEVVLDDPIEPEPIDAEPVDLAPAEVELDPTSDLKATSGESDAPVSGSGDAESAEPTAPAQPQRTRGGSTKFYGKNVVGNSFVFLIDNSSSMKHDGRMTMALQQLIQAVGQMNKRQKFYVIFYSDRAYPMFFPKTETEFLAATTPNKRKLQQWLPNVELFKSNSQGTIEALEMAFDMNPSTICLLTDGDWSARVFSEFKDRKTDSSLLVFGMATMKNTKEGRATLEKLSVYAELAESMNGGAELVHAQGN